MSEFRSMTIAVARNITENGADVHEITVDDVHADRLEDALLAFDSAGYEIVSVFIDGYDFRVDAIEHLRDANLRVSQVVALFNALCADPNSADVIFAFLVEMDPSDVEDWHESVYFYGADHEAVVREWADVCYRVYEEVSQGPYSEPAYVAADPFPSWMEIDWEETLSQIAREHASSLVEFNGMVYYFG